MWRSIFVWFEGSGRHSDQRHITGDATQELKIDEFQPEHLGKLQFYLEALDRDVKKAHEQPSIGLLLCATKNQEVVEYALSRAMSPALVAEYQTRMPDKKLLQAKLHEFYALAESQAEAGSTPENVPRLVAKTPPATNCAETFHKKVIGNEARNVTARPPSPGDRFAKISRAAGASLSLSHWPRTVRCTVRTGCLAKLTAVGGHRGLFSRACGSLPVLPSTTETVRTCPPPLR